MAKYVLNNNPDDLDFVLLGIVCQENQYQAVSSVNDVLRTRLLLSDYIPLNLKGGKIFKFSLYHFLDEELGLEYFLIPNNSNFEEPNIHANASNDLFGDVTIEESVKLVKELPKTDYFIILKGEDIHNYQFKIVDKLKEVSEFIQVQTIETAELPSRRNLIF